MDNQINEKDIDAYLVKMMQENPNRFIQYALLAIGREVYTTNANEFTFSQVSNLGPNQRFKIEIVGKISAIEEINKDNNIPKPPQPPKCRIFREDGKGLVPPENYQK